MDVISVREHVKGKWIISYQVWSACRCSVKRFTTIMDVADKPTNSEIRKYIKENES